MQISEQADIFVQKIKHLLITTSGHTACNATLEEFYRAFCLAFREEIMVNWAATIETLQTKKPRIVNFLSMEYMPGRLLGNTISNLKANELVLAILKKMNRNLDDLIRYEPDPGLGNGGLGRLASCFLDSLATLHYPARGYGLRYQYGIFEQEIWGGKQIEKPDCWLLNENPWELRRDLFAVNLHFRGRPILAKNSQGEDVYFLKDFEEVRATPFDIPVIGYSQQPNYSVLLLRLWSTKESPRNFQLQRFNAGFLGKASENTSLTDVLYPNDNHELGKRVRLKQEFVLVSASLQDIIRRHLHIYKDLHSFSDKVRIQLNDTHPALMIAEMMHTLTKNYHFSWNQAWQTCQECCSYTNHTILKEGLEEWNEKRMQELLPRQYKIIQKLNFDFCNQIRSQYPNDEEKVQRLSILENGQVRMAHLSIYGSHRVNGVAKLHTQILQNHIFRDFYEMNPEKFINVTNGVTQRRWLLHANPLLAAFITKRIGPSWICDFKQIQKLAPFASDPESRKEFLKIKKENKERLLQFLSRENCIRNQDGKITCHSPILSSCALFDMQIKRIHEYKRQLLNLLHLIMLFQEEKRDVFPRLSIFAGKAAPGYEKAKQIIQLICAVARVFQQDSRINRQLCVVFIENYNVSKAEILIPAADLSEQISTAGWEASGTGNMKLAINGALTIGTKDGANLEMQEAITDSWWPFSFGSTVEENQKPYHPSSIYQDDQQIEQALQTLKDGTFAKTAEEKKAFFNLYQSLVEEDSFRVLKDLRPYYETQRKVEQLFLKEEEWAKTALHNIAAMGHFSTDESIHRYANKIWGITACPPDPDILLKVQKEYAEPGKCLNELKR